MVSFSDKITVIVNSCDAYEDLWIPFLHCIKSIGL